MHGKSRVGSPGAWRDSISHRFTGFSSNKISTPEHPTYAENWYVNENTGLSSPEHVHSEFVAKREIMLIAQGLLSPPSSVKAEVSAYTEEDEQIISKLNALVPSAVLSYKQAILDLKDDSRVSFSGPALHLREALREVLDHLAPDGEVTVAPGYAQEKDRSGPTMKQKVRFIMKKKGKRSSSDAPEQAVTAFEEAIAAFTRAVYEQSSKATHVASERLTVVQLRRYVVAILHEITET
jgi:Predicted pPIWI-associating nuclease